MRGFLALYVFLVFPSIVYCQTTSNSAEARIERIISSGGYDGVDDKQLGRMGDAAAIVVTKVLVDRTPSMNDTEMILAIIHLSFSAEHLVEVADRKPRTTLFVLQYLKSSTSDQKLKRRIEEEKQFVLDQYAKSPAE